jgi:hypothetical protein
MAFQINFIIDETSNFDPKVLDRTNVIDTILEARWS